MATPKLRLEHVPMDAVRLTGGFLADRAEVTRERSLPFQWKALDDEIPDAPKSHAVANMRRAAAGETSGHGGHVFQDSDLYKWIEAASYALAVEDAPDIARKSDRLVADIAAAQAPDGYVNSCYALKGLPRWKNLRTDHELYCAGHLIEAAVARSRFLGQDDLLEIAMRFVDCIGEAFGRGKGRMRGVPGHEEIELALVRLWRHTEEQRCLDLARYFVDERGRSPNWFDLECRERGEDVDRWGSMWERWAYCQAHEPVRDQTVVVGHAVRAGYLYAAMADLAAETGDAELLAACRALWRNLGEKRMHVTGGMGPTSSNEGFTFDYDLPDEDAYAETCAAISLVFWAHRMLAVEADGRYADIMETALCNGVLSGMGLEGESWFYANPLASYPGNREPYARSKWFDCSCCPPNIARLMASIGGYVASVAPKAVWIHLYAEGEMDLDVGGAPVRIETKTDYPWDGRVRMTVRPDEPRRFTLALRIPEWCAAPTLTVAGKKTSITARKGYVRIDRRWTPGDVVELDLPMEARLLEAHPDVRQACGRVAVRRGPVIYCVEETDNGTALADLALPLDAGFDLARAKGLPKGVPALRTKGVRRDRSAWKKSLYLPAGTKTRSTDILAVPYALWANRAPGEMRVWLRSC